MEVDKKLETLEQELKLMKGELKQSLASVRDYLLNMELPASEFATVIKALGDSESQTIIMKGNLTSEEKPKKKGEPPPEESEEEEVPEPEAELPEEEEPGEEDEALKPEAELSEEDTNEAEDQQPEAGPYLEEEPQMPQDKINDELSQSIPKVNLLANLINWVAKAKKEIGLEQITTLLEVYGVSGHLSPELKEVILHLAAITSEQPEDASKTEIWSQCLLSLHGILTGGDAPLYPLKPPWNNANDEVKPEEDEVIETEVKKTKSLPVKLKLVFPDGDGKDKEFCIDLAPQEADTDS